jgi:hypothetical protein
MGEDASQDLEQLSTYSEMIGSPQSVTTSISSGVMKARKPRRPRKQPLLALGGRRVGTDLTSKDASQLLLKASSMSDSGRCDLYGKLMRDLCDFLASANQNWQSGEECRRFTIFGDCITCAQWDGLSLVSGVDIVKVVMAFYRLENLGRPPADRRKFEEGIISDLRGMKLGTEAFLKDANSPLLQFLYRINSVRTHKRQKVYSWCAVPFMHLQRDALARERRNVGPSAVISTKKMPLRAINSTHTNSPLRTAGAMSSPSSGGDSGSPRSFGSPQHERGGYLVYVPARKSGEPQLDIMKLAMVADAALTLSEETRPAKKIILPPEAREFEGQEMNAGFVLNK